MVEIKINKEDLQTGDTLLVKSKSWLGKAIRTFQKSEYNHAAVVCILNNEVYISEADKPGIILTPIEHYLEGSKYEKLMILRPPQEWIKGVEYKVVDLSLECAGRKGYDFVNLLFFQAIKYVTKGRVWLGANNNHDGEKRFICGEWCAYIYANLSKDYRNYLDWYKVGPAELQNNPQFLQYILK